MIAFMRRRSFLAAPLAAYPVAAYPLAGAEPEPRVYAFGDGVRHTPAEYAKLLTTLTNESLVVDDYSRGGVVEQLEARVAAALGKEAAVWLPTGTLANHLAVRLLAGNRRRVLVQSESHLFNDCGDCAQTLSGLHLVPLAPGRATFTMEDVDRAAYDAAMGRVETPIGAMQIETPVRRRQGERFDFDAMKKAAAWARAHNVGLHLDGARLFLESAYSGRPVKEYAALFDTVYVSMYKYFNAASGAVLAGPKAQLEGLYHTRRMFGGGLSSVWPFAAVARHYAEGFGDRYKAAVQISEELIKALPQRGSFTVERMPAGTNLFRLRVPAKDPIAFQKRLAAQQIMLAPPRADQFLIGVNETLNRTRASDLADAMVRALQD